MKIDQSSLDALYEIIKINNEIKSDDENFIFLLNSTAYRELRNDKIDRYSIDSMKNVINSYIHFKLDNQSEQDRKFTNSRLQTFEENYKKHNPDIAKIIVKSKIYAFNYLPAGFNYVEPTIALAVLLLDHELGWCLGNCIILNYTNFYDYNDFNQNLIAHELHHFFAAQIRNKNKDHIFDDKISGGIYIFILQMANEGIANLITIPYALEFPEKVGYHGEKIISQYKSVNENFRNFNNIITANINDFETMFKELTNLRKRPFVFHTLSYFIINKIYTAFGKETIFEITEYPLRILGFYNKAVEFLNEDDSFLINKDFISILDKVN